MVYKCMALIQFSQGASQVTAILCSYILKLGAGERVQQLRAPATLAEDLGLGVGIHRGWEAYCSLMCCILLTYLTVLSSCLGFGPVFTTSDPDSFWQKLNEIQALGGGDEPEMCLSALEV